MALRTPRGYTPTHVRTQPQPRRTLTSLPQCIAYELQEESTARGNSVLKVDDCCIQFIAELTCRYYCMYAMCRGGR